MSAADDRDEVEAKDGAVPAGVTDQADGAARNAELLDPSPAAPPGNDSPRRDWIDWIWKRKWILRLLLLAVTIPVGLTQGAAAVILVLVALALVLVIELFWASVRSWLGETPLSGADAYAFAAPRAEEEQKQAILRALQDLKYERSVGKISEEDYAALETKYRAEAKRLLRSLEDEAKPRRDRVESLVHQRLAQAGLETAPPGEPTTGTTAEPRADARADAKKGKKKKGKPIVVAVAPRTVEILPAEATVDVEVTRKSESTAKTKESPAYVPPSKTCRECSTRNDPDAVFCKKCGSKSFGDGGGNGKPAQIEIKTDAAEELESDQPAEASSDDAPAMETRR